MHIAWICGSRIVGGAERATLQIAALLAERGHRITTVCAPDSPLQGHLRELSIAAQVAPIGGSLNVRARGAIERMLAARRPDVALVTGVDEWVWACLSRRGNTRLVLIRHMALPLSWRVRWLAARRADAVIAVSRAVHDSLCARPPLSGDRVHVIYNPTRFPPRAAVPSAAEREQARRALGLPLSDAWIGFFGGHDERKGGADVLRALQRANDTLGPTQLLLCGRRSASARSAFDRPALRGRVHDLGETERMAEALTAVDVVVMATHRRLNEALPATLIEAMACGTPALAYATGGMAEIIGPDGQAGRVARADDAEDLARVLGEMLGDAEARARMAETALARARTLFDPSRAAERWEALLESLLPNYR